MCAAASPQSLGECHFREQMVVMKYESLDVLANLSAVAFYERTGFEPDQLVDTEGSPALRMRKRIC